MASKKAIWGWMFFDWASQPFHTLVSTFVFAPFFAASLAPDPARGQELWGYAATAGALTVAVTAPFLGAVADSAGPRKPWILGCSVLVVLGSFGLWFGAPGDPDLIFVLASFAIGVIGVELALVFTNAMLPDLGTKAEIGRISGSGWALGYWGGLVGLLIVLGFMTPAPGGEATLLGLDPILGLDPEAGEGARATGPMTAIWYVVFIIPLFLFTPDAPRKAQAKGRVKAGLRRLGETVRGLPRRPSLFAYLAGSMAYRDALNGLNVFGGIYAAGVLGWSMFQLGIFGIAAAFFGAIGAWLGGRADGRFGPKPVIVAAILLLSAVSALAISTGPAEVLFIPLAEGSVLPDLAFYFCGSMIGAGGGALQGASRTMMTRQAEEGRMTEAFGIFALAGKATSFVAPAAVAFMTGAFDSQRVGVTPILAMFVIGLVLMAWVTPDGEARARGRRPAVT